MKAGKQICKIIVMALVVMMMSPFVLDQAKENIAYGATVKLSSKSLSLTIGETQTLKLTGTESKATWTSSNKAVATVNSSGEVTAKKAGNAKITATLKHKKYSCKVTVKQENNPVIENAPFVAKQSKLGKIKLVLPKEWSQQVLAEQGNNVIAMLYPNTFSMTNGGSNIIVVSQETAAMANYDIAKEYFSGIITADYLTNQLISSGLDNATISEFTTSDYTTKNGTAFKVDYKVDYKSGDKAVSLHQTIYELYIENNLIEVTITDMADNATPAIDQVAGYLLDTVQLVK